MIIMDELRWVVIPLVFLGSIIVGALISSYIAAYFSIWLYYSGAIVVPTVLMYSVFIVAPKHKYKSTVIASIIGLVVAMFVANIQLYPKPNSEEYSFSFVPFLLVCVTTAFHLWVMRYSPDVLCTPVSEALTRKERI